MKTSAVALDFKKSYGSSYCIPLWLRDIQVKMNLARVPGRVRHVAEKQPQRAAIVGYGPSLRDTWAALRDYEVIFTTSGAHQFLLERGIVPTYHVDVDPRPHKVALLGQAHPAVKYLPCSTVHPGYVDQLLAQGADVRLWHCFSTEMEALRILPPGEYALTGGADAGLRAMVVARFMGYADLAVFGMDGCAADESGHAGEHSNAMRRFSDLEYPEGSGQWFRTTPHLLDVAKTVPHEVDMLKLDRVEFHGHGLVQAIMAGHSLTRMASNIAFCKPVLISEGWRDVMRQQHEQSPLYGSDGFRYADTVRKLVEATSAQSVLDYGCGKGVLAAKLDFPIWEYDPAVPGKDMTPKPADLVMCTQVLEHVEPEYLDDVLGDLARCVKKVGYLVMGHGSPDYWQPVLNRHFYVGKVSREGRDVVAVVGPKVTALQKPRPAAAESPVIVQGPALMQCMAG